MKIRSGAKYALTAALAAGSFLAVSPANANGRFPRGEHLIEYPSDPNHLLLAATYGLVTTEDGGKNWYYVCETAFSLYPPPSSQDPFGYSGDPLVGVTADESLLAGVQKRVTKSNDKGCGWAKSFEDPNITVEDIAVAPSNRNIVVALVRSVATNAVSVYQTKDGGATWSQTGTPLTMLVVGYTIDVDPKDPAHFMVTGITSYDDDKDTGILANTTNSGMTWSTFPIPKTNLNRIPYIAAVHPNDTKKIFIRTDEWVDDGAGASLATDALFYTKDGGQTWTELLRPKGQDGNGAKLFGFALSPDGNTVLAGYGDPVEGGGRNVDRTVTGVYKSTGADYSFGNAPTQSIKESATCLTWTAKGIYMCGSPDGMTSYIAFASDPANLTASGIKKILEVNNIRGAPPCCDGRAVTSCNWASGMTPDCSRFDACLEGGVSEPDAGVCKMPDAGNDSGGTGGSAGGAGKGGSAGAPPDGGTGGATGGSGGSGGAATTTTGTGGSGGSGDGCSCRTVASPTGSSRGALGLLLGLAGVGAWRSRRRQRGEA